MFLCKFDVFVHFLEINSLMVNVIKKTEQSRLKIYLSEVFFAVYF